MTNIKPFVPRGHTRAAENLAGFIARAKQLQPWPVQVNFASDIWTLPSELAGNLGNATISFASLSPISKDVMKAIILYRKEEVGFKAKTAARWARAMVYLDRAAEKHGIESIVALTPAVFKTAEEDIGRDAPVTQRPQYANVLESVGVMLNDFCLVRQKLIWRCTIKEKKDLDVFTQDARNRQKEMLPSREALESLGRAKPILLKAAKTGGQAKRHHLLRYALLMIQFATGLRVSELVLLPLDCLDYDDRKRPILRRIKASKGGTEHNKVLTPLQYRLCRWSVRIIRVLTAEARAEARWLEAHPGTVRPFDGVLPEELIGAKKAALLLGIAKAGVSNVFVRTLRDELGECIEMHTLKKREVYKVRVQHIYDMLAARRSPDLVRIEPVKQFISETLGIFIAEDAPSYPRSGRRVVHTLNTSSIQVFLARTIWKHTGLTHQKVASHQFRRLLDTVQREGGLSENEIALLMGRKNPEQNRHYDYRTPEQMASKAREAIRQGNAFGAIGRLYWEIRDVKGIPEAERYLTGALQVLYATPLGSCAQDIASEPCPFHLGCMRGCNEYIRVKGDERSRCELERQGACIKKGMEKLSVDPLSDPDDERYGAYERDLLVKSRNIAAALAIDHSTPNLPQGWAIRVFPHTIDRSTEVSEDRSWFGKINI
jgi:integrase